MSTPPQETKAAATEPPDPKGTRVSEIEPGHHVAGVFVLRHIDLPLDRGGKPFLVATLGDATGRVEARMWGIDPAALDGVTSGAIVRAEGQAATFQGRLQVRLDTLEPLDPRETGVDLEALFSGPERSLDALLADLRSLIESVAEPHLRRLLDAAFGDPATLEGLRGAPAALSVHHAWRGGLLEHTLGCARLVDALCGLYPQIDRDVALTGGLLHDLGKLEEFDWRGPLAYTDAGKLMGHLVLGARRVEALMAEIPSFPQSLRDQILHILISHHGDPSLGSAKPPMTLEALVVHLADLTDARVASWSELLENAGAGGWTDYSRFYDRPLFRPGAARKRKKRRGGRRRRGAEQEKKARAGGGREGRDPPRTRGTGRGKGPRRERSSDRARGQPTRRGGTEAAPPLTFNPFAELAGAAAEPPDTDARKTTEHEANPTPPEESKPPDVS